MYDTEDGIVIRGQVSPGADFEWYVLAALSHLLKSTEYFKTAPADLSLSEYWAYPKDMEWVTILAIKL